MTPEQELQAEIDAVRAKHVERNNARVEANANENANAASGEPMSRAELVETLAAISRDLNAVMTVMQSHFGRELVIARKSN